MKPVRIVPLVIVTLCLLPTARTMADILPVGEVSSSSSAWPVSFAGGSRQPFEVTGSGPLEILLEAPPLDIREKEGVHVVDMEGLSSISGPGLPQLPFGVLEIALPEEAVPSSVRVEVVEVVERDLEGTYEIAPAPPLSGNPEERPPGEMVDDTVLPAGYRDPSVYGQDALYPRSAAELAPVTTFGEAGRLVPLARVSYTPLRYNPVSGRLHTAERMRLRLSFERDSSRMRRPKMPAVDYVIVTSNIIRNGSAELANFVAHKTSQGHSVQVITEDDYGHLVGPYPNGTAEKIRKWLQDNWQILGLQYVLLVGNPDPADPMYSEDISGDVPMKQIWWGMPLNKYAFSVATDFYYADLVGTWDADGDGFYGEAPWIPQAQVPNSYLHPTIPRSGFRARFDGAISVPVAKYVLFDLDQWKGATLWVDGQEILNHWPQPDLKSRRSTTRWLEAGSHSVTVYYFQDTGHGHLRLHVDGVSPGGFTGSFWPLSLGFDDPPVTTGGPWTLDLNWETSDFTQPIPEMGIFPPDLDAEVSVGRIPVYEHELGGSRGQAALAALDKILRKIITYENQLPPKWRRKILLPMKPLGTEPRDQSYDLGEAIYNNLPENYAAFRIYDQDYGLADSPDVTPVTYANVADAWNKGFGMVTWYSHGNHADAMDVLDVFRNVPQLNPTYQVFTFQASCLNAVPEVPECYAQSPPCLPSRDVSDGRISLAYTLLKEKAVAVAAASSISRGGGMGDPQYQRNNPTMAWLYTDRIVNGRMAAGDALKDIKYTPWFLPGFVNDWKLDNYYQQLIYNLYGDPSTPLLMPEFHDNFSDGGNAGDDDWEEVLGDWSVAPTAGGGLSFRSPGDGVALAQSAPLAAARVKLRFKVADGQPVRSVSIFFDHLSAGSYRLIRMVQQMNGSWKLKLYQVGYFDGDQPGLKGSVAIPPLRNGVWNKVELQVYEDGTVKASLNGVKRLQWKFPVNGPGRFGLASKRAVTYFDDVLIWDGSWLP